MRNFGRPRQKRQACLVALGTIWLQNAVWAQPAAKGLAAYSSLLTNGFFVLLAAFIGLVIWEVLDNKKASRSSLDIAKLAAAAAKKQSAAGAPSGSLANLEAPPTSRPFAPPPPPPPPPVPQASNESKEATSTSPFASTPTPAESANPFAPPARDMTGDSPASLESTVAFNPSGVDAGSSGGWADLLQRVRAGEPESGGFQSPTAPPATEEEVYSEHTLAAPPPVSPASSSEAWEALLKRTTTGESGGSGLTPKTPAADVGKISLASSFGSGEVPPPPSFPSMPPASPMFKDEAEATLPASSSSFTLPSAPPPAAEPPMGLGFSFSSEPSQEASPFSFSQEPSQEASSFSLPPTPAPAPSGFEAPSFKMPGADDSGGFQLPGGNSPFDFGASEGSSSSTLPLSDLFSSKSAPATPPAFQLPSGGGGADPFGAADDMGLGRTISLDFAKGGGQKPPPPLPKTEG